MARIGSVCLFFFDFYGARNKRTRAEIAQKTLAINVSQGV
jgi:hypothetical protein